MTDATLTIRAFAASDWTAVCDVYQSAARLELAVTGVDPRAFRPMPHVEDLDMFLKLNTALVACLENLVVGFVAWRDQAEWRTSGYLSFLYVDPAHHGRGVGGRLLRKAMDALGDEAWLLVKQGNDPAIGLYERHGFVAVTAYEAETSGHPYTEIRMALRTSRKSDPDVPNFGP